MPTLTIEGRKVKVDDSFLSLSPEQQNATVEEIAASLGVAPANQSKAGRGHDVPEFDPGIPGYNPETGMVERDAGRTGTALFGLLEGVPVAGPALVKGAQYGASALGAALSGEDRERVEAQMQTMRETGNRNYPGTRLAANLTGAVATTAPVAATALGGRALGVTGNSLAKMSAASAGSNAAISAADTAARGGDAGDIAQSAAIGGGLGAVMPGATRVLGAGARHVGQKVGSAVRSVTNPAEEASRRIGAAYQRDAANAASPLLSSADEAVAQRNSQNLMNVDRGGETTRALARAASNSAPDARAIIEREASDRFSSQGTRVSNLLNRITGGATDDLGLQDAIRAAAKAANKPAYQRAYSAPAAQDMWHEGFEQLMQAPAMKSAAKTATTRGANRAAVEGFQPIRNPFVEVNGRLTLKKNADGTIARPTLQFWDQVKRNLDGMIDETKDRTMKADLMALKSRLVTMLDDTVPEYKAARAGASAAFGAEDAIDAGRKFASRRRNTPELKRAYAMMSGAEKKAFQTGYASELIDMVKSTNDRTNVIRNLFGSEEAREKLLTVFGPAKAKEIEAFVKVENAMDMLRGALGNSTTTRQLVEMGLVGGGTYAYTGGDLSTSTIMALTAGGMRAAQGKVNESVMKKVAEALVSNDPKVIHRAIQNAAMSKAHMQAIEAMTRFAATLPAATAVTRNQTN